MESGRVLALSSPLIIAISNEELVGMEFVYKLANFFVIEHEHQSNTRIRKKKKSNLHQLLV